MFVISVQLMIVQVNVQYLNSNLAMNDQLLFEKHVDPYSLILCEIMTSLDVNMLVIKDVE
jgi:hypothetical protein